MVERQGPVPPRKMPSQARARRTVDLILEASAQILAKRGEEALTTNYIAERAGFSIGTLYQYFPNRDSILDALIARERESTEERIRAALAQINPGEIADTVRAIVRILINSFTRHGRMRKRFAFSIMRLAMARDANTAGSRHRQHTRSVARFRWRRPRPQRQRSIRPKPCGFGCAARSGVGGFTAPQEPGV